MLKRSFLIGSMLAAILAIFAFGNFFAYAPAPTPSSSPCNDPICYIVMYNLAFHLDAIIILSPNPGTGQNVTVSWYNNDTTDHTVTSGAGGVHDSLSIDQTVTPGTFFNLTITPALYNQILGVYPNGVLPYFCRIHYPYNGMAGTLTISTTQIPEFPGITILLTLALVACAVLVFMRKRKLL